MTPQVAGQLRVQSIPAVFAFVDGRPVDGFTGALPDSQVKAFVERLAKKGGGNPIDNLLDLARESLELGDMGGAAQAYAQVLQTDPQNAKAIGAQWPGKATNGFLAELQRPTFSPSPPYSGASTFFRY